MNNLIYLCLGVYQCFVTNKLGTAMSNPVSLRKAAQFQEINGIQNATVGSPFQLSCKVPENAVGLEQNYWAYKKVSTYLLTRPVHRLVTRRDRISLFWNHMNNTTFII